MREKAFTLIEVMVVMAIISILAGMMMPPVWKFWESEDIATTRQRMKDLKTAMVGDKALVQNGVRTHYGFVGDFGELPFTNATTCLLNNLAVKDSLPPKYEVDNWNGPYLGSGFDSADFLNDAWGNRIKCSNVLVLNGRYVGVTLQSHAPGGELLEERIVEQDVTPTERINGNNFSSYSSVNIIITPEKTGAFTDIMLCKKLSAFTPYTSNLPFKLPIGRIGVTLEVFRNSSCTAPISSTNSLFYYMQDNTKTVRFPDISP